MAAFRLLALGWLFLAAIACAGCGDSSTAVPTLEEAAQTPPLATPPAADKKTFNPPPAPP